MIWRCEVRNNYAGKDIWTEVEITGDDFLTEFRKRFGKLDFRNIQQFDFMNSKWVKIKISQERKII